MAYESNASNQGLLEAAPTKPTDPTTPEELLASLQKDFERLKRQKARPTGGVEGSMLLSLCMLNGEHYASYEKSILSLESQDKNKLYLTFNLITPRTNKLMGRLSAFNAPFKARPNKSDPQALEEAEVVDRMLIALDEKVDQVSRLREILYWMIVGGTAFEHVPWIPNASLEPSPVFNGSAVQFTDLLQPDGPPLSQADVEAQVAAGRPPESFEILEELQQVGEVGSEIYGPANVFIDQNVRSIQELPPGSWVHVATIKTCEWIKENFPDVTNVEPQKEVSLISSRINATGESTGGTYLKDLIPMFQGTSSDNDPEMVLYVCSYQNASLKQPHGKMVCWIPKQVILHDDDNPYEEIPLVDYHWSPVTTSFWTQGYITPLIPPQRFLNKRMNQLGEQSNSTLYSNLLLGGGIKATDIPADFPGAVENGINENGTPNVMRMPPPEIPNWFLESINLVIKLFNDLAGGADLMEDNKFPGQLRGPMAVPMLQEILDTQWGPLFAHIGERLARVKQMRLNRVKQFYPPTRTMHYTDKTQKDEVLTFHTEKILRGGTNFSITVERGAILPELRALREARLTERLAGPLAIMYMDERTGQLDKSKIAADLQFGDVGREGRETTHRKLAIEINKMLWEGKPLPPVQPFYDHKVFLDELEASMTTTEFMKASPVLQQAFSMRWQQHNQFLQQAAMAQQQAQQSQQIQSAVAQATQQAAATAAAQAVEAAMGQAEAQKAQPTGQYVDQAQQQAKAQSASQAASKPQGGPPPARKRTLTVKEEG